MSEDKLHFALAAKLKQSPLLWCHVPNGEKRDKRTAYKLKLMGVMPGVPDVLIFTDPPTALELKAEKGRTSKAQRQWQQGLEANGWAWYEVRTIDEALAIIKQRYGWAPRKTKIKPAPRS